MTECLLNASSIRTPHTELGTRLRFGLPLPSRRRLFVRVFETESRIVLDIRSTQGIRDFELRCVAVMVKLKVTLRHKCDVCPFSPLTASTYNP